MAKLAIVILNWNGQKFLAQFLPALIQYAPSYSEIIIADNASTDNSIEFLRTVFPSIKIIQNKINGGFSKGYNDALQQVEAEYYCLLNSDVEVTENWIEPIVVLLDNHPDIAIVQPKLLSFAHKNQFEYAGACGGFLDYLGYPFCRGRVFEYLEEDSGQYNNAIEVFWATGAALFVRSNIFHAVNGLDDDFFAHMEEIDFCWRVKSLGYKVMVEPKSVVYHVGGGTLPKNSARKTYLNFRNNMFLLLKNLPRTKLLPIFLLRFPLDNIAALFFLFRGHWRDTWAVYRAQLSFLRQFRKMKRKRKDVDKQVYKQTFQKSIVFQHYIKKKSKFNGTYLE
ncbi:MAG: glycosyltransferase family 2 protein [Bacteroidetes bacterium]|nr:glycosyltransferase family 2 protein [Bacteroidota bacterium]MCL2303650.1 glycosyltransferase family 2 protein [Lentimicrobiaceae bacterium]